MGTLQTRLFKLGRKLANVEEFDSVGQNNLVTSIEEEDGTLAMYSTHLKGDPAQLFVFEVYASEEAYQTHASSAQFKAYVEMASTSLTNREVISVAPELMLEKETPLRVVSGSPVAPRLARITVPQEHDEAFREAVFTNMRASIAQEDGVLVMYAATLADEPTNWVFWEVSASEEAYAAHRDTDHFKAYIEATKELVSEKELIPLTPDTLVNKGTLGNE